MFALFGYEGQGHHVRPFFEIEPYSLLKNLLVDHNNLVHKCTKLWDGLSHDLLLTQCSLFLRFLHRNPCFSPDSNRGSMKSPLVRATSLNPGSEVCRLQPA